MLTSSLEMDDLSQLIIRLDERMAGGRRENRLQPDLVSKNFSSLSCESGTAKTTSHATATLRLLEVLNAEVYPNLLPTESSLLVLGIFWYKKKKQNLVAFSYSSHELS